MDSISPERWNRLINFLGYGNPGGNYWFIGMEEGVHDEKNLFGELIKRADRFQEVEDVKKAHDLLGMNSTRPKTQTWTFMSRIVLAHQREQGWQDPEMAKAYRNGRLGRVEGETFLTEVFPIPCKSRSQWPEGLPYALKSDYEREILPRRIKRLRELYERSRPKLVVCYGKSFWRHYESIFGGDGWKSLPGSKIKARTVNGRCVVLTPFLGNGQFSVDNANTIADFAHQG